MPSSTDPSPSAAAAAILTSDAPLPDIAARLKLPLPDLIKLLQSPDAQSLIESIIRIDTQRADHREQRSRLTALSTLESVCTDPASGPVEKRRAAAAILRGPGCHGSSGSAASRAPASVNPDRKGGARHDIAHWSRSSDDGTADLEDDADLDQEANDTEGTDSAPAHPRPAASAGRGVGGSATMERGEREPAPKPAKPPKLPDEPTPDQLVAHQLALIQAIDKPILTPRDIVHAIDYHNLAFPNRYYADKADAFQKNLEHNPILDIQGATLTAAPATIHDTTPPTATVRVTIERPAKAGSPDAQCLMPDASSCSPSVPSCLSASVPSPSCLFHLIHESMFFPDPTSPHAWHTQAITTDTS